MFMLGMLIYVQSLQDDSNPRPAVRPHLFHFPLAPIPIPMPHAPPTSPLRSQTSTVTSALAQHPTAPSGALPVANTTHNNSPTDIIAAPQKKKYPPSPILVPGVDIADEHQLATWAFEVELAVDTKIGPFAEDALIHIYGESTLAIAQCVVDLFVFLHMPHMDQQPFVNPPGIYRYNVANLQLESFLYESRVFIV